ncbi:hypothetical protein CDAR_441871 [Caerostris darwini]|uniref:Uncharacterized protein n=1 Tax=Caerostris darwini TaxID=1538125 RepID=A0AAV4W017_9ARAC|nr:hypothetical protein CDAR_441871 [Caerostris darwini]
MDEKLHRFCQHFQQGKIRIGLFVEEKHKQIPLLSLCSPFGLDPLSFLYFADIPVSIFFLTSFIQDTQNGCLDVSVCPHVMTRFYLPAASSEEVFFLLRYLLGCDLFIPVCQS